MRISGMGSGFRDRLLEKAISIFNSPRPCRGGGLGSGHSAVNARVSPALSSLPLHFFP